MSSKADITNSFPVASILESMEAARSLNCDSLRERAGKPLPVAAAVTSAASATHTPLT